MTTLTDFLLARVAEDERMWQLARDAGASLAVRNAKTPAAYLPPAFATRLLAECEAKRRIVTEVHYDGRDGDYVEPWCATCSDDEDLVYLPCHTLELLALPYADHPDYRDEWRP